MSHPFHPSTFILLYTHLLSHSFLTFSYTFQLLVLPFPLSEYTTIFFPLFLAFFSFSFFFSIFFHFHFQFLFLYFHFHFQFHFQISSNFISNSFIYLHEYFHIFRMFSRNVPSRHQMESMQSRCRISPSPLYW